MRNTWHSHESRARPPKPNEIKHFDGINSKLMFRGGAKVATDLSGSTCKLKGCVKVIKECKMSLEVIQVSYTALSDWEVTMSLESMMCAQCSRGVHSPFTQTLEGSTLRISVHERFNIWRMRGKRKWVHYRLRAKNKYIKSWLLSALSSLENRLGCNTWEMSRSWSGPGV